MGWGCGGEKKLGVEREGDDKGLSSALTRQRTTLKLLPLFLTPYPCVSWLSWVNSTSYDFIVSYGISKSWLSACRTQDYRLTPAKIVPWKRDIPRLWSVRGPFDYFWLLLIIAILHILIWYVIASSTAQGAAVNKNRHFKIPASTYAYTSLTLCNSIMVQL